MEQTMIPVDELAMVFSDMAPIPQDDGPEPVCVIQYPTSFVLAYNYMRAVWKSNEFSERTLRLSATCLRLNPANYTVWHYRRQCLQALYSNNDPDANNNNNNTTETRRTMIQRDLDLASTLGGDNPKNYQIWYHRRALLEQFDNDDHFLESELNYIAEVLEEDSKNYHAWSHRQWIIQTAANNKEEIWNQELEFAHKLIHQDPRNNSAWNQRWFASHKAKKKTLSLDVARKEADFAIDMGAKLDPFNESPWRYLVGILKEQRNSNIDFPALLEEYDKKAFELREVVVQAKRNPDSCVSLTSARIDILEMMGSKDALEMAVPLTETLANEHDPIRKKYWALRLRGINEKLEKMSM